MICRECETVAHCLKNGCVPKQPALKPLTDEQIEEIANDFEEGYVFLYRSFARAIEAAHGIKENT
jgi:hypothetical protein